MQPITLNALPSLPSRLPLGCGSVKLLAVVGGAGQCPCKIIKIVSNNACNATADDDAAAACVHKAPQPQGVKLSSRRRRR